jgi:hypothetical protein
MSPRAGAKVVTKGRSKPRVGIKESPRLVIFEDGKRISELRYSDDLWREMKKVDEAEAVGRLEGQSVSENDYRPSDGDKL